MACVTLGFHNIWENFDFSGKYLPRIDGRGFIGLSTCSALLWGRIWKVVTKILEEDSLLFWHDDERGRSVPYVIQSKIFTSSQPRGPLFTFFIAIRTWDLNAELLLIQIFIWLHYSCDVVSRNKEFTLKIGAVRMVEGEMCSMCW